MPIYSDISIFLAYDFLGPNNWVWTHCKFYPVKKNIHFANFSHTYSHIQKIKLLQLLWIAIWICYWNFKNSWNPNRRDKNSKRKEKSIYYWRNRRRPQTSIVINKNIQITATKAKRNRQYHPPSPINSDLPIENQRVQMSSRPQPRNVVFDGEEVW